jgi:hypothetical protein
VHTYGNYLPGLSNISAPAAWLEKDGYDVAVYITPEGKHKKTDIRTRAQRW